MTKMVPCPHCRGAKEWWIALPPPLLRQMRVPSDEEVQKPGVIFRDHVTCTFCHGAGEVPML